ncbi:unnamed protein product [Brachionus calyciflorus]|uniref:Uncharacterized protein n=1 Tax=Brachionus calyciflorus TaxID=104777 RepID=A0A814SH87_9BILA|nr:unnamed protein product [Brachionus calyciflorus]
MSERITIFKQERDPNNPRWGVNSHKKDEEDIEINSDSQSERSTLTSSDSDNENEKISSSSKQIESQIHSDSSSIEFKKKQVKKHKMLSKRKNNLKQSVN